MLVGEKLRLYPTKEQEESFKQFCGTARFIYNKCLAEKINQYDNSGVSMSLRDLIKYVQNLKYSGEYDWLLSVPEAVTKQAINDLMKAYSNFFTGLGNFPKFKKKGRCKESFFQRTDGLRQIDKTHIKITGIKTPVRMNGENIIYPVKNPRVSYDGKYWYLSYSYEVNECNINNANNEIIGVDLGIKSLAVLSNNTTYNNINKTKRVKRLKKRKIHLQRRLSKKFEMNKEECSISKSGKKYIRTNNIEKLKKRIRIIDRKLRNIRDTYIHQVTYDLVKAKPNSIVIEDLNVRGMMKNRHLSKAIQDQCFYKFREYLTYKCKFYGINLIVADRFFPSSKRCNQCGNIKRNLKLKDRTYKCDICGLVIDRDLNASINLMKYPIIKNT